MFALDFIHTVAFGGVVLFVGHLVRRLLPVLARYNVPAPVIGGLLVAAALTVARTRGIDLLTFDTRLQTPMMTAFFTTIGFGASLSLLRVGGPQVLLFFGACTGLAILQNVIGVLMAKPLGMHPLFGVLTGSVTLTGGPATGLAFAPAFEQAGVAGAETIAVAAAMVGIVSGGLIGGPVGTLLIERHRLQPKRAASARAAAPAIAGAPIAAQIVEDRIGDPPSSTPPGEDKESYALLKALVVVLVAMWIGSWVSARVAALGVTVPAYIGAMLVAGAIRNLDDLTGGIALSQRVIDDIGTAALSLFLVLALMTLRLWELAGLALLAALFADGPRLRCRGDGRRAVRLHARHCRQRNGQHGGARRSLRSGPARLSRRADGRRLLHRLRQRPHHHHLPESMDLTRDAAWQLLTEYTKSESLLKHALAVETSVRGYAKKFNEDENGWGIVALLHDFDYERWPSLEEHPFRGSEILRERGYPEWVIRAILSHADYSGVPRDGLLEKTLFACDELAGFITAASLVRPSKSVLDLEASSVIKRMKDKAFARGVKREDLRAGAELLGVPLDEHITNVIGFMRGNADALGLRGSL
jgi:ESS family glutamate:Na+ symporter